VGRRRDGSSFWASLNIQFRYDTNGRIIGTEAIVRDISDRRRMERAIQEANKKLNLLNSITRHDVANQLTVLQGYAHMAAIKRPEPVIADLLSKINGAAETISRQLDFTRTYQELGISSPAWFPLGDVVAKVRSDLVKLSNTCRGHEVFADPMLEKAFFNLFDNAVRHGGNVSEIVVRCERAPDGIVIIVEDNGVGIPPIEKEKIFEKGFGKHTGYGLFLVREILSITGITIRETGVHKKGARFEISVPKQSYRFVPPGGGKQPQANQS
jgi:signal transduction histidine kinase